MIKIESRETRTNVGHVPQRDGESSLSPTRKAATAALAVLTLVGGAASLAGRLNDSNTDITPVRVPSEYIPSIATPETVVLEPGSVMAVAEAQRIADITNPDEIDRQASVEEANRLTGFQP